MGHHNHHAIRKSNHSSAVGESQRRRRIDQNEVESILDLVDQVCGLCRCKELRNPGSVRSPLEQCYRAGLGVSDLFADLVEAGFACNHVCQPGTVGSLRRQQPGESGIDEVGIDQSHPATAPGRGKCRIGGDRRLPVGKGRRGNDHRFERVAICTVLSKFDAGRDKPEGLGRGRLGRLGSRQRCGETFLAEHRHVRDEAGLKYGLRLTSGVEPATASCQRLGDESSENGSSEQAEDDHYHRTRRVCGLGRIGEHDDVARQFGVY